VDEDGVVIKTWTGLNALLISMAEDFDCYLIMRQYSIKEEKNKADTSPNALNNRL